MSKIAFIGPATLAKLLKLQGIDTFACEHEPETRKTLNNIMNQKKHRLVFLTEALATQLSDLDKILTKEEINVMIIPDNRGGGELSQEKIDRLVKFALGGEVTIENG
ncbi:MAG: hypothetical protein HQ564_01485 [Candidatus Saganbacteria bacterium]|nr:hypothetical protein [Candidatus Saganbacteria bacterium]